ncbi:MAG: hypothetical protein AAF790_06565 [Planctomycetota bacterium]
MSVAIESFWRRLRHTRLRDVVRGRIDGRLDWRRVIGAAGLPEAAADVIHHVVRKARLWRRERVDVATELVAHLQDGLECGAAAEALAADFGDAREAARLIRRAKRRCRPLWWQAWWWLSRSAASLLGVYVLAALWLATSTPSVKVDYLAELNRQVTQTPVEDRAWPVYLEVARRGGREKHDEQALAEMSVADIDWPDFDALGPEASRTWIAEHQDLVGLIRTAAAKPYFAAPLSPRSMAIGGFDPETGEIIEPPGGDFVSFTVIDTLLPHIQSMRDYAFVLRQDALVAAGMDGGPGNGPRVLADIEAMLGLAKHCDESPFLVAGLVAIALDGIAYELTLELMRDKPGLFTTEQLTRLAHRVAAINYSVAMWVDGERMIYNDIVQRVYSDNGSGDGHMTAAGLCFLQEKAGQYASGGWQEINLSTGGRLALYASGPAAYLAVASRRETVDKYNALLDGGLANLNRPLWEIAYEEWRYKSEDPAFTPYGRVQYPAISLFAPAMQAVSSAVERGRGVREGWVIGIALELYRRDQGGWPASLAALSPRWLPTLPVDRINGTPLRYRVVDGRPLVYSLGVDADDDNGRPSEEYREQPWAHRVGPPRPEKTDQSGKHPHDGDWVVWSLAEVE